MKMKAKGKEEPAEQTRKPRHSPKHKISAELSKLVMEPEEFTTLEPGGSMWTSLESWHQAPSGDNPQNTYYLRSKASFEAGEEKSLARHERISSCGRNSEGYLKIAPGADQDTATGDCSRYRVMKLHKS